MRVVASPYFTKSDLGAIRDAVTQEGVDALACTRALGALNLDDLADEIARNHVRALAWMLTQGSLDVRLIVPRKRVEWGDGLFHQKIGILRDSEGEIVSFSGSINETASGWMDNIEEFKKAGVTMFGVGSSLTDKEAIENDDYRKLQAVALQFVEKVSDRI